MIPQPLLNLIKACETICVAGCCGLSAFDFSPIHMASYLIRGSGEVCDVDVTEIRAALEVWRKTYGSASGTGYTSDENELNAIMGPDDVDELCNRLESCLQRAIDLARSVEAQDEVRAN